ncbi:MAG TPA: 50S ribosomal protein L9 [Terriglobales bacterium]|nr:50S ribosomal protein L9 [Terriglobales bacterium]
MEVILKEDVPKLGFRGDVVKVAEGYGRNYLLPRKLAIEATKGNRAVIEQMKAAAQRRSASDKADAEGVAQQMQELTLTFRRKVGEQEHLFGSVTSGDIADALEAKGFTVDRRKVHLDDPIKALGEFQVAIRLHKEVMASVKVVVEKEAEKEAEKGE